MKASRDVATAARPPHAVALDHQTIHLWSILRDEPAFDRHLDAFRSILPLEERKEELRYRFGRERRRHVVARGMLRMILSRYAPVAPMDWRFRRTADGCPVIANAHPDASDLRFSLSHTDGLTLLGVTRGSAIGVDVERYGSTPLTRDMADHFFARSEAAWIRALSDKNWPMALLELWTLKEAFLKARGIGLAVSLDSFSFALKGKRIDAEFAPGLEARPRRWRFATFRLSPTHYAAVCSEASTEVRHPALRYWISPCGLTLLPPVRDASVLEEPLQPFRQSR